MDETTNRPIGMDAGVSFAKGSGAWHLVQWALRIGRRYAWKFVRDETAHDCASQVLPRRTAPRPSSPGLRVD